MSYKPKSREPWWVYVFKLGFILFIAFLVALLGVSLMGALSGCAPKRPPSQSATASYLQDADLRLQEAQRNIQDAREENDPNVKPKQKSSK